MIELEGAADAERAVDEAKAALEELAVYLKLYGEGLENEGLDTFDAIGVNTMARAQAYCDRPRSSRRSLILRPSLLCVSDDVRIRPCLRIATAPIVHFGGLFETRSGIVEHPLSRIGKEGLMAVISKLGRMMEERGTGTVELAARVGITPVNLSRIKTGRVRSIRFSTLNALCRELECEPGDILGYFPDEKPG